MVDLNDEKYIRRLTRDDLLRKYSELDIFKNYIGDFELGVPIRSPLRNDDRIPSFNVFYSKRHNRLFFKDFAGKRGDCVMLVQELLGIPSYREALERIDRDMSTYTPPPKREQEYIIYREKPDYTIQITARDWQDRDLAFWAQFGISLSTLELFNVLPISGYFHNLYYVYTPDIAYAYLEYKDEVLTFKIYRPLADKTSKWRNNHPYGVHDGYRQLPPGGPLLIITKSRKDVMSLYEVAHQPAIAVQSETCFIKDTVVEEYKERFGKVVTLFDNDSQGIDQAYSYKRMYDVEPIMIPSELEVKDFSDLVMIVGPDKALETLSKLIN